MEQRHGQEDDPRYGEQRPCTMTMFMPFERMEQDEHAGKEVPEPFEFLPALRSGLIAHVAKVLLGRLS